MCIHNSFVMMPSHIHITSFARIGTPSFSVKILNFFTLLSKYFALGNVHAMAEPSYWLAVKLM